jgi:DNA recombination protein RmuC
MTNWIAILTVLAVIGGLGLILYALARLSGTLKEIGAKTSTRESVEAALLESKLRDLTTAQNDIGGRFAQLVQRIETLDQRLGENLKESATKTAETLGGLQARLKTIDDAQKNISALSGQVVNLQNILSDKQARGAFGQERMEAIIEDQLPPSHYEFQFRLSNGKQPDCIIRLAKDAGLIVIDSKFPLEAFDLLRQAASDEDRKIANARMRVDVLKHVKDISEKYIIKGETQTPIIMFIPSESVFAELHHAFPGIMKKARDAKVAIMSPHLLWLAVTTMQAVLRDVKMREHADIIQKEVGVLLEDVRRLGGRIETLRGHFDAANKDVGLIETSMRGIDRHAERIAQVDFSSAGEPQKKLPPL